MNEKNLAFTFVEGSRQTGWGKCNFHVLRGDKDVQPLRRGEVELRHCEEDVSPTKQSSLNCTDISGLPRAHYVHARNDGYRHLEPAGRKISMSSKSCNVLRFFGLRPQNDNPPRNDGGINNRKELINSSTYQLIHFKKSAFTLAEVLITIGVIGVVAAMTIPTLMANIKGLRNRAQFKKTLSTLNQAVRMNKAKHDWDFTNLEEDGQCDSDSVQNPETDKTICAIWYGNINGVRHVSSYNVTNASNVTNNASTFYQLADGAIVGHGGYFWGLQEAGTGCTLKLGRSLSTEFNSEDGNGTSLINCTGYIDINGELGPNKFVECSGDTETALDPEKPCVVKNSDITDIFPIVFHDDIIEPATNAAKYVLNTAK
ncbi:type II secretion system protein [bacterium]|nr:type II secretion system protein [bacterium]